MYNIIFFTNILRLLDERGMTKYELSEKAGISISFLSDLTNGKANPSLKIMEAIAEALKVPLTILLEYTDLDRNNLDMIDSRTQGLPPGYERVFAVLPEHQAFIVKKWSKAAQKKLAGD
ncbi:transcriptional regulator [Xylella fastidiosa]|uniref:Transcriptional regulator n=1 Tax=Xylella fastidiosa TaxID=2371 RepID=A0ABC8AD49_XYLFS|nr:transcriptional regulator [Xylella fastidiosa]ALR06324.1 transcriptional regulator [Xylella fastidiosa]AWG45461.1 transcriptional regulator [Xylella fastidiosa]